MSTRVVIIGNGVAGIEAALVVRQREPGWSVTLVSEESEHFFSRTALMYALSGQLSRRDLEPHERDLYQRQRFNRVRGRAVGLDRARRVVKMAGGLPELPYDRLLLATGSAPRPGPWPGSELPGVGHFVTMQDLDWLEAELHGASLEAQGAPDSPYRRRRRAARPGPPQHPVVVGGGLIGSEVVETLLSRGCRPRFLIKQSWFWPIALDAREAAWVADHLRAHGVEVGLDTEVVGFEAGSGGDVAAVETGQGRFPCDLAVIAIGVVPNTAWLADSGLARDGSGGLVVDEGLRCSDPDVFAAGDCASVPWYDGRRRPEQLWYTSRDQGRVAGRALVGDTVSYRRGIWYNSAKFLDIEYTTAGLVGVGLPGEADWYHQEQGRVRSTTRIIHQDGVVVGFNLLGRRWDHRVLIRWIEERRRLPWVLRHLNEARFDTEFVPALRIPTEALV